MPKYAKVNFSKKLNNFFFLFHKVIYLLFSISQPSLKLLALMFFFRYLDYKFSMPKFAKGNNSIKDKITFLYFHQAIYILISISWPSLKLKAVIIIWNILITKYHYDPLKEHNSTKGDNKVLKIYVSINFWWGIYLQNFKLYLNKFWTYAPVAGWTDGRTHGQA